MTREEMEKKRDDLAAEKMEPYLPDYKNIVGAMVCVGWDACAEEYEKYLADLRIGITSLNNKIIEQNEAIENIRRHLLSECNSHNQTREEYDKRLSLVYEGLEFYADENNWNHFPVNSNPDCMDFVGFIEEIVPGGIARSILKGK